MDRHISEILTTSIRNQIDWLDPDIRFSKGEIENYLKFGATIGFITEETKKNTTWTVIMSSSSFIGYRLKSQAIEAIYLVKDEYDDREDFELQVDEADKKQEKLKYRKYLDVLTFHRLCLKKFKTANNDLVRLITMKHFKFACESYQNIYRGLLLFLYLRMNIKVLNIPYMFPEMYLSADEISADSDISTDSQVDECMEGRCLEFTKHNSELYNLILETVSKF